MKSIIIEIDYMNADNWTRAILDGKTVQIVQRSFGQTQETVVLSLDSFNKIVEAVKGNA